MSQEISAQTFRLFAAIPIPEAVKSGIEKAQIEMRHNLPEGCVRWTKRGQFHLTLRFLGNVEERLLDALVEALSRACERCPVLHLRAGQIGFFPPRGLPRVVWVGLQDDRGKLALLQDAVESAVGDFTREKSEARFAGHVTLGRVKAINRSQAEKLATRASGMADRFFGEWTADKVEIIRSELSSEGSRYTTLAAISLFGQLSLGIPPE